MSAHLQQGEYLHVWILCRVEKDKVYVDHVFTHKVQAEAALRHLRTQNPGTFFNLVERVTVPHDNHC